MKTLALVVSLFSFSAFGGAIKEKTVEYKQGDTVLEGFVAYPANVKVKHPGVVIIHEWMGLNDYAKNRARQVARLGYVAFAADIYGKGVRAKNADEAGKLAGEYKGNRALLRARVQAAYDELLKQPGVDASKIAAVGYCFGGTTALELARSGSPVLGVVSFHGGLSTPNMDDIRNYKGKILALHGADDPAVPPQEVADFKEEMKNGGIDMKFISYKGAVHGFTNPDNGPYKPGAVVAYNKKADKESWSEMEKFFKRIFKNK